MGDFNPRLPTKYNGTNKYITFFVTRNRSPTGADYRQPETGTLYALGTVWQVGKNPTTGAEGDLWMLSKIVANVAYWVMISSGVVGPLLGLTTPEGTSPVFPNVFGLINLLEGTGITITGGVNSVTIGTTAELHDLHVARYIVSAGGGADGANFTTLATAYAAAVAAGGPQTVFMQPGTYTIGTQVLSPDVNICSFDCDASTPNVILIGELSFTVAGSVALSGLYLQTNSAPILSVTGSAASIVEMTSCFFNCTNNTGIVYSSSNAGAFLVLSNCGGNLGTTGITFITQSSPGSLDLGNTGVTNTGGSTTASTISAGVFNGDNVNFQFPLTFSGTSAGTFVFSTFSNMGLNTTMLTLGGSGVQSFKFCRVDSGSASAVVVSTTAIMLLCDINSTNTNAISGSGSLTHSGIVFTGTSKTINTTTQTNSGTLQGSKNIAPAAGFLGEQIRSYQASGVGLTTSTGANITSISLTPGVWDVSGVWQFISDPTTNTTIFSYSLSPTSATLDVLGDDSLTLAITGGFTGYNPSFTIPSYRVTVSTTTTFYLVAAAVFSVSTMACSGRISATRVG
jgi:hypothetical protein